MGRGGWRNRERIGNEGEGRNCPPVRPSLPSCPLQARFHPPIPGKCRWEAPFPLFPTLSRTLPPTPSNRLGACMRMRPPPGVCPYACHVVWIWIWIWIWICGCPCVSYGIIWHWHWYRIPSPTVPARMSTHVSPCAPASVSRCTGRHPRWHVPMAVWVYLRGYVPRCVPQCVSTRVFPGGFPGVHLQAKENSGGRNEKNERESGVKRKKVRIYYVYTKRKEGPDKRRARGAPACVARTYVLAPQRETNLGPCHPAGPVPIAGSDQTGVGNRALSPGGLGLASRRGGGLAPRSHRRQTARRGVGNLGAPAVNGMGY